LLTPKTPNPAPQVMNKSLTTKFKWAIEEATEDFRF
jgi:hypothetical protein